MLLVPTYLAPSPIHGIGCFASKLIPAGEKIWTFHPMVDLIFDIDAIKNLPDVPRKFLEMYGYIEQTMGAILCGDNARFFNHADYPTTKWDGEYDLAARNIRAREEITADYRGFNDGLCRSFLYESN